MGSELERLNKILLKFGDLKVFPVGYEEAVDDSTDLYDFVRDRSKHYGYRLVRDEVSVADDEVVKSTYADKLALAFEAEEQSKEPKYSIAEDDEVPAKDFNRSMEHAPIYSRVKVKDCDPEFSLGKTKYGETHAIVEDGDTIYILGELETEVLPKENGNEYQVVASDLMSPMPFTCYLDLYEIRPDSSKKYELAFSGEDKIEFVLNPEVATSHLSGLNFKKYSFK